MMQVKSLSISPELLKARVGSLLCVVNNNNNNNATTCSVSKVLKTPQKLT